MNQADRRYRPDIDGLRALAVGIVMIFHAFPVRLPGGFVGVDVFFVISGYLISGIILDAHAAGRFTFANFYARRIRRIFPALGVVLTATIVAGWFLLYADDYARLGYHAAAGAAFFSNIALWREASYFDVAADLKPLLHLWSLGVEEQFYFVWPVLLILAARWRRGPLVATLAIGTLSFLVSIWTVRIDRTPAFYAPWNRFWELLAGATLACIDADVALRAWKDRLLSRRSVFECAAAAGLIAIIAGVWLIDRRRVFPGLWVLLPVGGTALLIISGPRAWLNRAVLSRRPVVFVGLISYPLYLWHWPLLSLAHLVLSDIPPASLRLSLLAASVALAWATYRVIERPIRFGASARVAVPAVALALTAVAAAGTVIYSSGGMIERPVNRNEAGRLVDYYERLRTSGLADAYRLECDFKLHQSLDPSCTAAGSARTVFLWGDSFAQALSLGIRESLPADTSLAQVATSACFPQIENVELSVADRRCETSNQFAMATIRRLQPDLLILAQASAHNTTDWPALTLRALNLGAKQAIVVGPSPRWQPTLPRVYAEHHLADHAEYVATGLETNLFAIDRELRLRLDGSPNVTYLSLLDRLCRDVSRQGAEVAKTGHACLARVPGEDELDLMAVDSGHLSPKGSSYVGRTIWKPYFDRALP
jgi:peptidoglycan/LPS O-acetylase OafA/YrhL